MGQILDDPSIRRVFTQRVRDQFVPLVNKAAYQFLNEQINERLKNVLGGPGSYVSVSNGTAEPAEQTEPTPDRPELTREANPGARNEDTVTTEEELEGYRIVRAIVCSEVPIARIVARDTKTYFGILLDDNNRKSIARLWFNPLEEIHRNFR
jgi:hypothetical protein